MTRAAPVRFPWWIRLPLAGVLLYFASLSPAEASRLFVTDQCFPICPLVPPPFPLHLGEPHGFLVAAIDDGNAIDAPFTGTVVFTSSDPKATLPPPYRFTASDFGIHNFQLVMRTPGAQTLVASDQAGILQAGQMTRSVVGSAAIPTLAQTVFPVRGGFVNGLASGPDGNVWYSATGGASGIGPSTPNGFGRITPEGVKTEFDSIATFTGGVVTGSDGNLWFASAGNGFSEPGRIGRMTPGGVVTLYPVPLARSAPQDVALGPDGNVWFTDAIGAIGRITSAGTITIFPTPTSNSVPFHIAYGSDGALWFTEFGADKIGRIDTSGVIGEYALPRAGGSPWGIAAGPDGRLWYTKNGRVGSIGVLGDVLEFENPLGGAAYGIGAGPDGALWFGGPGTIVRLVPGATIFQAVFQPFSIFGTAFRVITGPDDKLWYGDVSRVVRAAIGDCGTGPDLCLDGRFRARVDFQAFAAASGAATPIPRTANAGYFWFFTPNNVDLAVKIVDGRPFNGRYWVFVGSLTNVQFTLTVTDTSTGAVRTYHNAPGQQASLADTDAFP